MSLIFQKMLFFLYFFFYGAGVYPFSFAENENLRANLEGKGLESERESKKPTDSTETAVSPFIGFIDAACVYA